MLVGVLVLALSFDRCKVLGLATGESCLGRDEAASAQTSKQVAVESTISRLRYFREMLESLTDLQTNCQEGPTAQFRASARELYLKGFTFFPAEFYGYTKIVDADRQIGVAGYRAAFSDFNESNVQQQMTTTSGPARSLMLRGIRAGADGNYPLAERIFQEAYKHATPRDGMPESLYFLGLSRLAIGDAAEARATWCFALPGYGHFVGPSYTSLAWNFLIANRLAH
jgi:hypothetical protein